MPFPSPSQANPRKPVQFDRVRLASAQRLDQTDLDDMQTLARQAAVTTLANVLFRDLTSKGTPGAFRGIAISGFQSFGNLGTGNVKITQGVAVGVDGTILVLTNDTLVDVTAGGTVTDGYRSIYAYASEVPDNEEPRRFWSGNSEVLKTTDTRWRTVTSFVVQDQGQVPPNYATIVDDNGIERVATLVCVPHITAGVVDSFVGLTKQISNIWGIQTAAGNTAPLVSSTFDSPAPHGDNKLYDVQSLEEKFSCLDQALAKIKGGREWYKTVPVDLNAIRQGSPACVLQGGAVTNTSEGGVAKVDVAAVVAAFPGNGKVPSRSASLEAVSLTLTNSATHYIYVDGQSDVPALSSTTVAATAYSTNNVPLAIVTTGVGTVAALVDVRLFYTPTFDGAYTVGPFNVESRSVGQGQLGAANFTNLKSALNYIKGADAAGRVAARVIRVIGDITATETITMQADNVTIEGAGGTIRMNFVNTSLFNLNGKNNLKFKGLRIEHVLNTATASDFGVFLGSTAVSGLRVEDVTITNTSGKLRGFCSFSGALTDSMFERCHVEVSDFGVRFTAAPVRVKIRGNTIRRIGAPQGSSDDVRGISYSDVAAEDVTISDNTLRNFTAGVRTGGFASVVSGNIVRECSYGVHVSGVDSVITGNTVIDPSACGVLVGASRCSVTNNVVRVNRPAVDGINLNTVSGCVVTGNVVSNTYAYDPAYNAIRVVNGARNVVIGNATQADTTTGTTGTTDGLDQVDVAMITDNGQGTVKRVREIDNTGAVKYRPLNT